jgi:hypothetical protein
MSFIHHNRLRYRIEIGITPRSGAPHVADEHLVALGHDGQPKTRPHYAPHYPHLTALKKELKSWFFYYFEGATGAHASAH